MRAFVEALGVPKVSFPQQNLFPSGASGALLVATAPSRFEQLYATWRSQQGQEKALKTKNN